MPRSTSSAIEFRHVGHRFDIPAEGRIASVKEWVIRRLAGRGSEFHRFVALDDISFKLADGRALGVIGRNGAGKSTLLRIAGGILQPGEGAAIVLGRVAPVIELGIGFEQELTGRENIIFNGALLGRSLSEMNEMMDEIVTFAELGEFIDRPIRTYSTGMVARLAFSVATTVEADVLLLDEVLSVGDERFQRKCGERIEEHRNRGASVLFVSHDLDSVEEICDEVLWLEGGRIRKSGPAPTVIEEYRQWSHREA